MKNAYIQKISLSDFPLFSHNLLMATDSLNTYDKPIHVHNLSGPRVGFTLLTGKSAILAKDNFADVYSKDKGMIEDFLNTHLEDIKGQKDDEIADEFQEWFYANFEIGTDLMDEDMAKLREHFKRFK